jgi:hypothetical protein
MAPHHRKACGRIARYRFVEETQDTASLLHVPCFFQKNLLVNTFQKIEFQNTTQR